MMMMTTTSTPTTSTPTESGPKSLRNRHLARSITRNLSRMARKGVRTQKRSRKRLNRSRRRALGLLRKYAVAMTPMSRKPGAPPRDPLMADKYLAQMRKLATVKSLPADARAKLKSIIESADSSSDTAKTTASKAASAATSKSDVPASSAEGENGSTPTEEQDETQIEVSEEDEDDELDEGILAMLWPTDEPIYARPAVWIATAAVIGGAIFVKKRGK